jgi:drug/metabolite transporter (DMT)-like permease
VAAIVLVSSGGDQASGAAPVNSRRTVRAVGYGIASGVTFGIFFLFIRNGGESGALWPVVAARLSGTLVFLAAAAGRRIRPAGWRPDGRLFAAAIGAGAGDASANVCYVLATRAGLFGLAVVLTSLYPGVTVLLARFLLGERMTWARRAGLALAAVGILMVTV